jgi:tryptophanyl-tRNA synthetase
MEDESSIRKKVRSAVTDTGLVAGEEMSPGVANLFEILELATELSGDPSIVAELRADFAAGKLMYSRLKDAVFESLMKVLRPIQQHRAELEASGKVEEILAQGANKARAIAQENIARVRDLAGLG